MLTPSRITTMAQGDIVAVVLYHTFNDPDVTKSYIPHNSNRPYQIQSVKS